MSCLFPYISYRAPYDVLFIRIIRKLVSYIRVSISRPEQSFQLHHSLTTAATQTVSGELCQQLLPQLFQVPLLRCYHVLWNQQLVTPTDTGDFYK